MKNWLAQFARFGLILTALVGILSLWIRLGIHTRAVSGILVGGTLRVLGTSVWTPRNTTFLLLDLRESPDLCEQAPQIFGEGPNLGRAIQNLYSMTDFQIAEVSVPFGRKAFAHPTAVQWHWGVDLPLWLPLAGCAAVLILARMRAVRFKSECCRKCHYDLRGNVSGRCPECGTLIAGAVATARDEVAR